MLCDHIMMHGPCGKANFKSPCMNRGIYIKHFPKKFVEETTIDKDGYPVYRRRDLGATVGKKWCWRPTLIQQAIF